jgi:hypothetical protein
MFSDKSHYLLLTYPGTGEVAAFTHFQFVWDDDDEPEYPVLYCFELHVDSSMQVISGAMSEVREGRERERGGG